MKRKVTKVPQKPANLLEEDIKKFVRRITEARYFLSLIISLLKV